MTFGLAQSDEDLIDQWDKAAMPKPDIDSKFNSKAKNVRTSITSDDLLGPLSIWYKLSMGDKQSLGFCDHIDTEHYQLGKIGLEDETATQYYLSNVVDLPNVSEIYAWEESENWTKFVTVLNENDYDVKMKLYDIEGRILDFYPDEKLYFRVTVCRRDSKPEEVPRQAVKLYPDE